MPRRRRRRRRARRRCRRRAGSSALKSTARARPPLPLPPPTPPTPPTPPHPPHASHSHPSHPRLQARQLLVDLRVHLSSPHAASPAGQQQRNAALERLFHLVQLDGRVPAALFNAPKGLKLLSALLPLWPPQAVHAVLLALAQQLPGLATTPAPGTTAPPSVESFNEALASSPKALPPGLAPALLEAVSAHGAAAIEKALARADVRSLLLGLLCRPGLATEAGPAAMGGFYAVLMIAGRTSAVVWALLDAALPSADAPHVAVLRAALAGAAAGDAALAADCAAASAKFAEALALRAAA